MKCRNCDNQLQPGWIACPACGERFVEPVPQAGQVVTNLPVVPKKSPNILGCGCLAVIVIIIIGYAVGSQSSSSSSEPDATPPASQASTANSDTTPPPADSSDAPTADAQSDNTPPLQVQSWSWSSDDNFITVNGTVTNVSDQPMSNVEALVTFDDSSGNSVVTSDALISYNPILPGQTSPFQLIETYNPEIKTASLAFQYLGGAEIDYSNKPTKHHHSSNQ